ncbi:hypothetical protein Mame01_36620 [Microbispora amethystogenes]|nr:hypothetical protein Mame01_36620 [Microbispora amethystogenes]
MAAESATPAHRLETSPIGAPVGGMASGRDRGIGRGTDLKVQRMAEHRAAETHEAAHLAVGLGRTVRKMREARGWSQSE